MRPSNEFGFIAVTKEMDALLKLSILISLSGDGETCETAGNGFVRNICVNGVSSSCWPFVEAATLSVYSDAISSRFTGSIMASLGLRHVIVTGTGTPAESSK